MMDPRTSQRWFWLVIPLTFVTLLTNTQAQIFPRVLTTRILNGVETEAYEAVGIVGSLEFGGYCSGTLITPRHVITAAHCAELTTGDTDGTFFINGTIYTTVRIVMHPDYNDRNLDNDIAIYELSEDVPNVVPAAIFRDEPMAGDFLTIVGFGGAGTGATGSDETFGTKRSGVTMIESVTETLVGWEFDSEDEANTAPGDSGGPGFLEVAGEIFLASITSGGSEANAGLGDVAFNTRVDAFAAWIDDEIDRGAELPVEDPVTEDPTTDVPPDTGCSGGGHGHGHGLGGFFQALNDWFLQEVGQTFIEWLTNVLMGTSTPVNPAAEDPVGETPIAESPAQEPPVVADPGGLPVFEPPVISAGQNKDRLRRPYRRRDRFGGNRRQR